MISYFRNVHLCLTRRRRDGCQWRQKKGLLCLIWPLLQMSSLSAVYSFHLVHIIQKHLQTNPDFRGQATKSLFSRDLVCSRAVNRSSAAAIASKGTVRDRVLLPGMLWAQGQAFEGFWHTPRWWGLHANQLSACAVWSWTLGSRTETVSWKAMRTCYFPGAAMTAVQQHVCSDHALKWQLPSLKAEVMVINARDPFWPQTTQ